MSGAIRIDRPPYADVKAYGARGDGTTDDTAAFVRAATAAYALGHRTVFVPAGTFALATTLGSANFFTQNNAALTILGVEGSDSTPADINYIDHSPSRIKATNRQTLFELTGSAKTYSGMTFKNLVLDGNDPNYPKTGTGRGVWLHNYLGEICDLTFENVTFRNFGAEAIRQGNDSEVTPRTSPFLPLIWKAKFSRIATCHCGKDSIRLCDVGTECVFEDYALMRNGTGYWCMRVHGGSYTQIDFRQGHMGNSETAVTTTQGSGILLEGTDGRYTFTASSFEGWKGAAVQVSSAASIRFTECFWLDTVGGATQTILTYDSGNPANGLFFFNPQIATDGSGWKNGHPIEFLQEPPPVYWYHATLPTTTAYHASLGVRTINGARTGSIGTSLMQRFSLARIDLQPFWGMSNQNGGRHALQWAEPQQSLWYGSVAPDGAAYTDGDTVWNDLSGFFGLPKVAFTRYLGGTWKEVWFKTDLITSSAPASATANGTAGTLAYDGSYLYVCTATNVWKRVAIATW